jgi:hypothetical protein
MKSVTIDNVISFHPCWLHEPDGRDRLRALAACREHWTALDCIDDLPQRGVSSADILWLILRPELIDEDVLHSLACDFAQAAVDRYWTPHYPKDNRPQNAIDAKRKWLKSKTKDNFSAMERAERYANNAAASTSDYARQAAWSAASASSTLMSYYVTSSSANLASTEAAFSDYKNIATIRKEQLAHVRNVLTNKGKMSWTRKLLSIISCRQWKQTILAIIKRHLQP